MNITETMNAIRWLFDKHCKDTSLPQSHPVRKSEYNYNPPLTLPQALAVYRDHLQGYSNRKLCEMHGISLPSVHKIIKSNAGNTSPTIYNIKLIHPKRKKEL